ncbi:MAG: hypothetical protein EBQ94_08020 [Flavobacteriales bacterium]|nr:hypothetical protein [Flavobacteriales bacterium]
MKKSQIVYAKNCEKWEKLNSDKAWDELQVKFLNQHQYFTKTAVESRQKKKEANIQLVLDRLQVNDYID